MDDSYNTTEDKQREDKMTKNLILRRLILLALILSPMHARTALAMNATDEKKLSSMKFEASKRVKELLETARKRWPEYKIILAETYRTQERQDKLYKKGKNTTTVRISKHTLGLAADIYFTDGKRILAYEEAPYLELGKMGEDLGLTWGGRWKIPFDPAHYEWRGWYNH